MINVVINKWITFKPTKVKLIYSVCACVVLLLSFSINPVEAQQSSYRLKFEEYAIVPDSIFNPDMGIEEVEKIHSFRLQQGLEPLDGVFDFLHASERLESIANPVLWDNMDTADPYVGKNSSIKIADMIGKDEDGMQWTMKMDPLFEPPNDFYWEYNLLKAGVPVFDFTSYKQGYPAYPLFILYVIDGEWILWYQSTENLHEKGRFIYCDKVYRLVVGNIDLSRKFGLDICLEPVVWSNRLFFLFQQDGKWGWFMNGELHPGLWDRVQFSYASRPSVWRYRRGFDEFFALRDGSWFRVQGKVQ